MLGADPEVLGTLVPVPPILPASAALPKTQTQIATTDARSGTLQAVVAAGALPETRAYHSFVAVGTVCYAVGGRIGDSKLCKGRQMLQLYDAASNRWITPGRLRRGWFVAWRLGRGSVGHSVKQL